MTAKRADHGNGSEFQAWGLDALGDWDSFTENWKWHGAIMWDVTFSGYPDQVAIISESDCIDCGACVDACPNGSLTMP